MDKGIVDKVIPDPSEKSKNKRTPSPGMVGPGGDEEHPKKTSVNIKKSTSGSNTIAGEHTR